jgi:hypothetical protein
MPDWRITKLKGECCLTWADATVPGGRRRYRLGTSDPKEAARIAPARYADLTRPMGTTVNALWGAYCLDMTGRAVVAWPATHAPFVLLNATRPNAIPTAWTVSTPVPGRDGNTLRLTNTAAGPRFFRLWRP